MVKNKKLSKSSVAIIVLALLLIASLVMGMTGAWFTSQKETGNNETLKFGVIKVTPSGGAIEAAQEVDLDAFLPGDALNVGAATIANNDEDAYVLYRYQLVLEYALDADEDGSFEGETYVPLSISDLKVSTANDADAWLELGNEQTAAFADGEWHWVLIEGYDKNEQGAKTYNGHQLTFAAFTYTFNTDVENYAYDNANHVKYCLNFGDDGYPQGVLPKYTTETANWVGNDDDRTVANGGLTEHDYDFVDLRGAQLRLSVKLETKAVQVKNIPNDATGWGYLDAQATAWGLQVQDDSDHQAAGTYDIAPRAALPVAPSGSGMTYAAIALPQQP